MTTARPRVYLAGPEVFLADAAAIGAAKLEVCGAHGLQGCYPLTAVADVGNVEELAPPEQALRLFDALIEQLDSCHAVIANLTPFRGPSADVGTAWELGYAVGRGLPVAAYTNVPGHYATRVAPDGFLVESFDLADNLMLEGSVMRAGGAVVRVDGGADPGTALAVLDGFEACVRAIAERLST